MGTRSRYDRDRPVTGPEADEARAYHVLATVVAGRPSLEVDRRVLGQIAQVLHATGNELGEGRGVPVGVRRAVRGLASALRELLDPRENPATAPAPEPRPARPGPVGAAAFRAAP